jgi:hypothetical protein
MVILKWNEVWKKVFFLATKMERKKSCYGNPNFDENMDYFGNP